MMRTFFFLCFAPLVLGFQLAAVPLSKQQQQQHGVVALQMSSTEEAAAAAAAAADADVEQQEQLPLTPMQTKTLRKEIIKRQARNTLPKVFLPELETMGPFSQESLTAICNYLEEEELVEVRSIAIGDKKHVHGISELLALELGRTRIVERVITKGHATVFYSQSSSKKANDIILRTSYQPGAWTKKVKAPRDFRGQIVKE